MRSVYIPANIRGVVYTIFSLLSLGVGATQIGYAAAETGQPTWLTVTIAVTTFVGAGIGYTAATNTQTDNHPAEMPD